MNRPPGDIAHTFGILTADDRAADELAEFEQQCRFKERNMSDEQRTIESNIDVLEEHLEFNPNDQEARERVAALDNRLAELHRLERVQQRRRMAEASTVNDLL